MIDQTSKNFQSTEDELNVYRSLFNNMLQEVHIWKLQFNEDNTIKTWTLVDANDLALNHWGKKKEDILGKPTEEIFSEADPIGTFLPIVSNMYETKKPYTWESYFEGTKQILEMISIPVGDYFISTGGDITSKKQTENFVEQVHRMESAGSLVGELVHDIGNILSIILLSVRQAKLKDDPSEQFDAIEFAAKRGSDLTKGILSLAKGTEDETDLNLKEVIEDVLKITRATFPKDIKIEDKLSDENLIIHGKLVEVYQILINIFNNAKHAIEDKQSGNLVIQLDSFKVDENKDLKIYDRSVPAGNYAKIEITDTGCGMSGENLEKIFEPYFTTKCSKRGTGLGMSILKRVINRYDGFIDIQSTLGSGTTVTVLLPTKN